MELYQRNSKEPPKEPTKGTEIWQSRINSWIEGNVGGIKNLKNGIKN